MSSHLYSQPFSVPLFFWSTLGHENSCERMQLRSSPWSLQKSYESFSWLDFTGSHCSDFSNRSMQVMEIIQNLNVRFLIWLTAGSIFCYYFHTILSSNFLEFLNFHISLQICCYSSDTITFEFSMLDNGRITSIRVEKITTLDAVMKGRIGNSAER